MSLNCDTMAVYCLGQYVGVHTRSNTRRSIAMNNVEIAKTKKIKPENQVNAKAVCTKCKFVGTNSAGFGPISTATHFYMVFLQVEGVEKIIKVKVKEKAGWGASVAHSITTLAKSFSKQMPVQVGEQFTVVYDKTKPKKCNIVESQSSGLLIDTQI